MSSSVPTLAPPRTKANTRSAELETEFRKTPSARRRKQLCEQTQDLIIRADSDSKAARAQTAALLEKEHDEALEVEERITYMNELKVEKKIAALR